MRSEAARLIISNGIAIINFIILCYSQAAIEKSDYLKIQSLSMFLMIMVYAVMGLWISVFSNLAIIIRNLYNSRSEKPKLWINIGICLMTVIFCIIGSGGIIEWTWVSFLPLVSLIFYSISLMVVKSRVGMAIVDCIDALMWVGYDFKNMLVMNVVTDLFNITMGIGHPLLDSLDKEYVFVNRKLIKKEQ